MRHSQATHEVARQQPEQPVRRRHRAAPAAAAQGARLGADGTAAARIRRHRLLSSRRIRWRPTSKSLQRLGVTRAADLPALLQRGAPGRIKLAGTVIDKQERTSAKGNRFAFVQCSDQSGAFEVTVFSEVLGAKRNLLEAGQAVLISCDGRLDGEQVKLMAQIGREARGCRGQFRRRAAHRDLRSRPRSRRCARRSKASAAAAGSRWSCRWRRRRAEVEVTLARRLLDRRRPARHHRHAAGRLPGGGDLSRQPGLFEQSAPPKRQTPAPRTRCCPSSTRRCCGRRSLPARSGSAPRRGSSRAGAASSTTACHPQTRSARRAWRPTAPDPAAAHGQPRPHLLRAAHHRRVRALCRAGAGPLLLRGEGAGHGLRRRDARRGGAREACANPHFLDAGDRGARVRRALPRRARSERPGPLVFQVSPLPRGLVEEAHVADRAAGGLLRGVAAANWAGSGRSMPWSCAMPNC